MNIYFRSDQEDLVAAHAFALTLSRILLGDWSAIAAHDCCITGIVYWSSPDM